MNLQRILVCLFVGLSVLNCVGLTLAVQQDPVAVLESAILSVELGSTNNVHQDGRLYFAGQFSADDIDVLKQREISRVISLRTADEIDWDEKMALENAGIEFIEIPFSDAESLTDNVFDRVREELRDQSKTTLFHCGSANRVGGTWLPYRVLDQGVELETALAEAKEIGLKTPLVRKKALAYIQRKQKPAVAAGESSVKPGINKNFLDRELDVDAFVQRFEIESREIFVARERILEASGIQNGNVVADVGAGTGLFTRLFADRVGTDGWVYAVDVAPRFIEYINQQATEQKLKNITCVLCAEDSVSLPSNSVDVVFICDTYHHFEYPKSTLTSMHRALREGGRLIVIDFERIPGTSRDWLIGHVRAGKEVVRAEIQDAGFSLVEEKQIKEFKENFFLIFRKD
jgi:ubiquinone/menaquinone biosynthesis C-methylase UbiE/protein tyrosine phosphatase (PTP) superfamily phosphohydrolase (DUF442 family)